MAGILDLKDKRILVVEDDDMNFIYLTQIFKLMHGNIIRAKDGRSAVEMANSEYFDLILMDIQLPDINGNEATRLIRQTNSKVPIIAQTASRTPDETDDCIDSGCNSVLSKPYTFDQLSKVLTKYLT